MFMHVCTCTLILLHSIRNAVDNMHFFMILKVHSVIHVHDFKCTLSNSVYNQTFKSCSMNRSTCGNTQLKLKLVHFDNIMLPSLR